MLCRVSCVIRVSITYIVCSQTNACLHLRPLFARFTRLSLAHYAPHLVSRRFATPSPLSSGGSSSPSSTAVRPPSLKSKTVALLLLLRVGRPVRRGGEGVANRSVLHEIICKCSFVCFVLFNEVMHFDMKIIWVLYYMYCILNNIKFNVI